MSPFYSKEKEALEVKLFLQSHNQDPNPVSHRLTLSFFPHYLFIFIEV